MKTAISIPDKTFEAAETLAKDKGMSRSELYRTAIEEYLRRHEDAAITERLNRIYSDPRNQPEKQLTDFAMEMLRRADWGDNDWYAEEKHEAIRSPGRNKAENAADQQPQRCARVRQMPTRPRT